tara:strand:+ start:18409 stop:18843 length:435 start_codon:yes stop_codon:yes gene_type:complete
MLKFQILPAILLSVFLTSCVSVSVDRGKKKSSPAPTQGEAIAQPLGAPAPSRQKTLVEHEIVSGDSLWKIARQYETSVAEIKEANQLDSDVIIAGQTLKVPTFQVPEGQATNELGIFESGSQPAPTTSTAPPPPPVIIPPITSS